MTFMRLFIKGQITPHNKMKNMIKPGGTLHVRLVDPRLRRPFIFNIYNNIEFPFDYCIDESSIVSGTRKESIYDVKFYLEVIYRNPGDSRTLYYGEAWGKAGKLYLLNAGAKVDLILNGILTNKNHQGEISLLGNDISAIWIDVSEELKDHINFPIDILVLIKKREDDRKKIVASSIVNNLSLEELPFAHHNKKNSLKIEANMNMLVYYEMIVKDKSGKYFFGGRGSKKVMVEVGGAGLRLVATREISSNHLILNEAKNYGLF